MAYVKIDDVPGLRYGQISDVTWSDSWGNGACGPQLASFTLDVDPSNDSSWLRLGRKVEVFSDDGKKRFGGRLSEMGRGIPREIHAKGWASRAADFDALDASGNPTTNPRTAVTQAIARGLEWSGDLTQFDDVALGDSSSGSSSLDGLLNAWAATNGKRWGVDAEGAVFVAVDPTTPTWWLDASDLDIGVADDGLFTRVRPRYVSAVNATTGDQTITTGTAVDDVAGQVLYGVIEYAMDLTALGVISSSTATAYAQQQLDLLTVPQWLSRVTTNPSRLRSAGGMPAHLPSVRSGQMVQLFNVPNNLGGLRNELSQQVVLGETEHSDSDPTQLTIAPVGLAVRNLVDALTQAAAAAKAAQVAGAASGSIQFVAEDRYAKL